MDFKSDKDCYLDINCHIRIIVSLKSSFRPVVLISFVNIHTFNWSKYFKKYLGSLKYLTIELKIDISTQNSKGYFGFRVNYGVDFTPQLNF